MRDVRRYPLIDVRDAEKVKARFGALPTTHGVPLIGPPPKPADSMSPDADLIAHERWYQAWKDLRRKGIGASEVATVNGVPGAYGSPFALWWQKKTGLEVAQGNDDIMAMGTRLEEVIGQVWQERNPDALLVRPGAGLFQHPNVPWLMATPDFLAVYPVADDPWPSVAPVECKAYDGGKGWGTPGTDEVPPHILVQILMQIDVLGAERGYCARMQGKRITLYTIEAYPTNDEGRRRAMIHHWMSQAAAFVASLAADVPPPIDGSSATEATLAAQHSNIVADERAMVSGDLAFRYRAALADVRDAKARLLQRKNLLREAMGEAEYATDPDGIVIAQRRHYKRAGYTVAPAEIDGVWPVGEPPS